MRRPGGTHETETEFAEFMAARSGQLYRSAYLLTTSQPAAEDILQTALAKAYAAWPRVRRADDPVAYVHGILIKTFLSERRRRSSTELPVAQIFDQPADGASTDQDPTDRLALMTALAQLSVTDRAVVVLRFWEDRSVAQTAQDLGLDRGRRQEPQPARPARAAPPPRHPHPERTALMNDLRERFDRDLADLLPPRDLETAVLARGRRLRARRRAGQAAVGLVATAAGAAVVISLMGGSGGTAAEPGIATDPPPAAGDRGATPPGGGTCRRVGC